MSNPYLLHSNLAIFPWTLWTNVWWIRNHFDRGAFWGVQPSCRHSVYVPPTSDALYCTNSICHNMEAHWSRVCKGFKADTIQNTSSANYTQKTNANQEANAVQGRHSDSISMLLNASDISESSNLLISSPPLSGGLSLLPLTKNTVPRDTSCLPWYWMWTTQWMKAEKSLLLISKQRASICTLSKFGHLQMPLLLLQVCPLPLHNRGQSRPLHVIALCDWGASHM